MTKSKFYKESKKLIKYFNDNNINIRTGGPLAKDQVNAVQKKWMSDIAEWAQENLYVLYGDDYNDSFIPIELHHVTGRSSKKNKIPIGHEFILPVPYELHNVMSNHKDNVTNFKKSFVKRFGAQRDLFNTMVAVMSAQGYVVPCYEVLDAIRGTGA